jgi:hypothetical protein
MKKILAGYGRLLLPACICLACTQRGQAQTDGDAIMMNKNQFCNGLMVAQSSWDHYWEGTLRRTNENLGTVTTSSLAYMANYGIRNNLNVMAGLPYVRTKASAGTAQGLKGFQDLSVFVKWRALHIRSGKQQLSLFAVGGISTPVSNYVIDLLPFSIGLGSTNASARVMMDYQRGRLFATAAATYTFRSNVHLDRYEYFDTELHLSNEVKMPDAASFLLRAGYRGKYLIAELLVSNWTTLGGFDISRNNMPFPSNRMNSTTGGLQVKYTLKTYTYLSLIGGGNYVLAGRNVGQSLSWNAGLFYAFYFTRKDQNHH